MSPVIPRFTGRIAAAYGPLALATQLARALPFAFIVTLAGCGGQTVDTPTDLTRTTYPAGQAFTLSFTMQACSDMCAEYDEPSCGISVNEDDMVIDASPSLSFDRNVDDVECPNRCGPARFAHCEVPAIGAGTWTVEANGFTRTIVVE